MGRRETPGADPRAARYLGIALLAPALPMWGLVPVTLLLPPSAPRPAAVEGALWVSAVVLGR